MFLKLFIQIILIYLLYRLIKSWWPKRAPTAPPSSPSGYMGEMVQDPMCGIYVPQQEAYPVTHGNEIFYFCSSECRKNFIRSIKSPKPAE